jgi:O-antigen/teichoic acid export membrane protein
VKRESASGTTGLRAGAVVFIGVGVANFTTYLFHLISARSLGPASYGDVATLAAVIGILTLPLAGAQVFVARHVASASARHRPLNDENYVSAFGGAMAVAGLAVTLLFLALAPVIQSVLSIGSLTAVVIAIVATTPAFVAPVLVGAAQGVRRFTLLAASVAIPSTLRVVFVWAALAAGFGVAGAMGATLFATLAAVAIPAAALRRDLRPLPAWRPKLSRADAVALMPVVAGTLAIALLTTDDLVAAKAAFSPHVAGLYGAASLIGRVILYLPAAIVTVLLPNVSALVAERRDTGGVLARGLAATGILCGGLTIIYAVAPHLIARIAFGAKFEGSASLLWMFGIAMTLYSLLNVLLFYRLGHGETRICWILLAGAGAQIIVYAAFHSSPRELLFGSIATGAVLLAITAAGVPNLLPAAIVGPATAREVNEV